jgi:two-component system, chemotaxis family, CheB/CheR fusion protein
MNVSRGRMVFDRELRPLDESPAATQADLRAAQAQLRLLQQELDAAREARRRSSDILRDLLYSSPVATFLLDRERQVEFFTPAAESLFRVLSTDLGRPFAELGLAIEDAGLETDIAAVMAGQAGEREGVVLVQGTRYSRRVMPRRSRDHLVDGAVVSYIKADILVESAPATGWGPLSEARHELVQPLQTLRLLHGVLRKRATDPGDMALHNRLEEASEALSGLMSALFLQAELRAGSLAADTEQDVALADVMGPLRLELGYHAAAKGADCRIVPCSAHVRTDPTLLACLVRMLVLHAMQQTSGGRLLIGCRSRDASLRLEIWHGNGAAPGAMPARGAGAAPTAPMTEGWDRLARMLRAEVRLRDGARGPVCSLTLPMTGRRARPAAGRAEAQLPAAPVPGRAGGRPDAEPAVRRSVCVVDDDPNVLRSIELALAGAGIGVDCFKSVNAFLAAYGELDPDCLIVDARMPETDGFSLIERLRQEGCNWPFIMITGAGDVQMAVRAMKAGATDFIEKPVSVERLIQSIGRACDGTGARDRGEPDAPGFDLTPRQLEVMDLVVQGHANKEIAARLRISQRTVENHRAAVMRRTGARSLPDLIRMRLSPPGAGSTPPHQLQAQMWAARTSRDRWGASG